MFLKLLLMPDFRRTLVSGRNAGSFLEQRVVIECIVNVVTGNLNWILKPRKKGLNILRIEQKTLEPNRNHAIKTQLR